MEMRDILDLDTYPLDRPESGAYAGLLERSRAELAAEGMFSLAGFMRPEVAGGVADAVAGDMETASFHHKRRHNIYFKKSVPGLADDHPALKMFDTSNHTLCADQLADSPVTAVYEWPPLLAFLAAAMDKPALHMMDDPIARFNVMAYGPNEALNWHFDRSEFTTTLLLQAPERGGAFEYRTDLRTPDDPNYDGVARLVQGQDPKVQSISLSPGTLNVFRGVNTPHRVAPVEGAKKRVIAVFSYYERAGVRFTAEEQLGFYGRTA